MEARCTIVIAICGQQAPSFMSLPRSLLRYSWNGSVIWLSIANSPPYGGKTLPAKDWETVEYRIRKISVNEDHERPTHSVATRVLEGEETPYSRARLLLIA